MTEVCIATEGMGKGTYLRAHRKTVFLNRNQQITDYTDQLTLIFNKTAKDECIHGQYLVPPRAEKKCAALYIS